MYYAILGNVRIDKQFPELRYGHFVQQTVRDFN